MFKRKINYKKLIKEIHSYDEHYKSFKNEDFRMETERLKGLIMSGKTLDQVLPEAYSMCREAISRVMGIYLFDVQLMGGIALHKGRIAEMRTGEGKTVAAVCPAYLNALMGKSVHVVTVNEYLAKRDSEEMGRIYQFLGMSTGCVYSNMQQSERVTAYGCDITYGTNSEFGFDYLRDNLTPSASQVVQRGHYFVILDEVDSILIDDAKTPLIISGADGKDTEAFRSVDMFVKSLKKTTNYNPNETKIDKIIYEFEGTEDYDGDYIVNEKNIMLTEKGVKKAEAAFGVNNYSDPSNALLAHYINQSLYANYIMKRDVDYMVDDGKIIIINESTGRAMPGQKYSNNLHQAIEAKENVEITKESKILATISYQNYFRMYEKIGGMTGTAVGSDEEFKAIYGLVIEQIPTNRPMIRDDKDDKLFFSKKAKYEAVTKEVISLHESGRPVLIGTPSVEESEIMHGYLKKTGIPHNVLNAKNHALEAMIVARAGRLGAVTIATNMAGRGTDILLGGDPRKETAWHMEEHPDDDEEQVLAELKKISEQEKKEVSKLGGLAVIGIERFESRRIDNQLCGRAGRQGDPGSSQFYVSLEDSLFQFNGGPIVDRIKSLFPKDETDNPFTGGTRQVTKMMKKAQEKTEGSNYAKRKNTIEYDDVDNVQRNTFYSIRKSVVTADHDTILGFVKKYVEETVDEISKMPETEIRENISAYFHTESPIIGSDRTAYYDDVMSHVEKILTETAGRLEMVNGNFSDFARYVMLNIMDSLWTKYLESVFALKTSVNMSGMGSLQPIQRYKIEAINMFDGMVWRMKRDIVQYLCLTRIKLPEQREEAAG